MNSRRRALSTCVLAVLGAVWSPEDALRAQTPAPSFRAAVTAVRLDAFAHDNGTPITGLTAQDFLVLDNGVEQVVEAIGTTTNAHVIVGLDTSGSVDGATLDRLRQGVRAVVGTLSSEDRLSLFTFADRVRLLSRAAPPRADLETALRGLRGAGGTTLHDAVVFGSALSQANTLPAILLIFTDGQDTASWTSAVRALDVLRTTNVVVYTVAEGLPAARDTPATTDYFIRRTWVSPEPADTLRMLRSIAEVSGGDAMRVGRGDRLATTFTQILARYRQRYLLTYTPTAVAEGGWHRIEVRLRTRPGVVTARQGYGTPGSARCPSAAAAGCP